MNRQITLDHRDGIVLDTSNAPFGNFQAFHHNYSGLKFLADTVRNAELAVIENDPHADKVVMHLSSGVNPIVPCAFNWFAVTVVNYLRLVALAQLMNQNGWKSPALSDKSNAQSIKAHCREYVKEAVPEIYVWRNKVAAHFAATDPFKDDSMGTLEQSIMNSVVYKYPYYHVGLLNWVANGEVSELPQWALTEAFENLATRFWPELELRKFPEK